MIAVAGLLVTVTIGRAGDPSRNNDFTFARVIYGGGDGGWMWRFGRWDMDFPSADLNMIRVLRRQTTLQINEPQSIELTDPDLFEVPFLYILEVGTLTWTEEDTDHLREYLLRGGFMMVDDFHGSYQWAQWESQIKKVFPNRAIEEISTEHPIFHCYYDFDEYPLVPGTIASPWAGGKYEQDGAVYGHHCRGIFDDNGRLMVLINWNTDLGDGWEHAADPYYPREYSEAAYRLGINYAIYAMTH